MSSSKPLVAIFISNPLIVVFVLKLASELVIQVCHTSTTKKKNKIVRVQDNSKIDGQCMFLENNCSICYSVSFVVQRSSNDGL
jgi:hypothetical protein